MPVGCGHGVFTDRRKLFSMITAYFDLYLRPHWEAGLQFARCYLLYHTMMACAQRNDAVITRFVACSCVWSA